jgi:integrative and conjugative element protein (TIGR02256 family)
MTRAWLFGDAEAGLRYEALRFPDSETGGLLVGYWSGEHVLVTDVIGPGPGAVRSKTAFLPDDDWQTAELAQRYAASGRCHTYLGDWHTHPGGGSTLSRQDRRTLKGIAHHADSRAPRPLLAILAPAPDGDITIWRYAGRGRRPTRLLVERLEPGAPRDHP